MINRAMPVPGTEERISPLTMIAKCFCGADLVRIPLQDLKSAYPWYHFNTARVICGVGIYPSQVPVAQEPINL